MAFVYRNKRLGYDSISTGNASGQERHVDGGGGIETTRTVIDSGGNTSTSALAVAMRENVIHNPTSADQLAGIDTSTAPSSGYTSGSSFSSAIHELL